MLALLSLVIYSLPFFLTGWPVVLLASALLLLPLLLLLIWAVPVGRGADPYPHWPDRRIDERRTMFARRRLQPGSERFEQYYHDNPAHRESDDIWRGKAGLLNSRAALYEELPFAAAEATFDTVEYLWPHVDLPPAVTPEEDDSGQLANFLKSWLSHCGAYSVGITPLQPYHFYSHRGRQEPWGEEIAVRHTIGIALTVEMDKSMIDPAPRAAVVMESSLQYLKAGVLAMQAANFLRKRGYKARAHIDGNYEVICPLVARDAGLGEIGRMGLLMTPRLGPRVRIAVVTTDAPLIADSSAGAASVVDFCRICKKCAETCPAGAIPAADRREIDGVPRWQINQEKCFTFWCRSGTDCARCIAVCPYSHPDSLVHNLVRAGIRRSALFRRLALWGDDLLYGRKPKPKFPPVWLG